MTMYVEVLSRALNEWKVDLKGEALLHYALACRAARPAGERGPAFSAHRSLATEIAYDRALIDLANSNAIDTSPERFRHRDVERSRLEAALVDKGIDLELLSRARPPTPELGFPTLRP